MDTEIEAVADRYIPVAPIGSGGMATVWRAHDRALDRPVALKRLHPHLAVQPGAGPRFRREALAAAALDHSGVVTVHDVGVDASGPYIVMEFVDGESLSSRLGRLGSLPPAEAARIALAVAEALDHAHRRGVVHRDIKPANILLGPGDRVRVADFGIARNLLADDRLTDSGVVLGTTPYMAPEVMSGGEPGPLADVYALGVVLYEMLTGRLPFSGDNALGLTVAKRGHRPTPPSALIDLPTGLERVVLKAIEGQPNARPADAASLAAALRPFTEVVTPTSQTPLDAAARPQPTAVTSVVRTPRHAGGHARRPLGWLLAGLATAVGVAAIAVTLLDGQNGLRERSASSTSMAVASVSTSVLTNPTIAATVSVPTPTTGRQAAASTPPQGTPARAVDDLRSGIAGLVATGSIERQLAIRFDRDAQKALRYWVRGDDERAGAELRGLLEELHTTQNDGLAEDAIRELNDQIARVARTMGLGEVSRNDDDDSGD
jgi:eukaryotic-like serine/threonine-protein kinase